MSFRFDWGGIDLCFSVEKGIIKEAVFYSDSLNPELMLALPEHLTRGHLSERRAICKALASHETADPQEQQMLSDILEAVNGEDFKRNKFGLRPNERPGNPRRKGTKL